MASNLYRVYSVHVNTCSPSFACFVFLYTVNDQRDSGLRAGPQTRAFSMTTSVGVLLAKGLSDAAYNSTFLTNQVDFLVNQVISLVPKLCQIYFCQILSRKIKDPHFRWYITTCRPQIEICHGAYDKNDNGTNIDSNHSGMF